jgi:subtilisin family serine protease
MYPAALPQVISVGALDSTGAAAPFTNYGPWVDACTLGVDVVSIFFDGFDGDEPMVDGVDSDQFRGWATWSGTSFAAPRVVAALAERIGGARSPQQAVRDLIAKRGLPTKPMLGTVVRP